MAVWRRGVAGVVQTARGARFFLYNGADRLGVDRRGRRAAARRRAASEAAFDIAAERRAATKESEANADQSWV